MVTAPEIFKILGLTDKELKHILINCGYVNVNFMGREFLGIGSRGDFVFRVVYPDSMHELEYENVFVYHDIEGRICAETNVARKGASDFGDTINYDDMVKRLTNRF